MRLNRLDLTRYGKFTNEKIDFGDLIPGEPDFHIVYGPNESGKSTAFSAYLDLLFGIEMRSKYAFLHERTMLVGADLLLSGKRTVLQRVKTNQNSLLDENGKPAFDGPLAAELGNLNRGNYATMFSLDDRILEHGGEEIIKSKGDLGQLLYAASAGLNDLSKKLDGVREKTEEIYKKGGSKNKIAELRTKLIELKVKKEEIDTLATEYKRLLAERDRLNGRYEAARIDLATNKSRLKSIGKFLSAYPHLAALRRDRSLLERTPECPDPPSIWYDKIAIIQTEETENRTLKQVADADVKKAREALDVITVDDGLLRAEARLGQMEQMKAKHISAEEDLPSVREDTKSAEAEVAAILVRLERPNHTCPASLVLPLSLERNLQAQIEAKVVLEEAATLAEAERTKATGNLSKAKVDLVAMKEAGGQEISPVKQALLSSILGEVRRSNHDATAQLHTKSLLDHQAKLRVQLLALLPWSGEVEGLEQMAPPSSPEIQRLKDEFGKAQKDLDRAEDEVSRLTVEHGRLAAARDTLTTLLGVVADQQAHQIREQREQAWAIHRRTLDVETAEAFDLAMRRDDEVTYSRHSRVSEIAKTNQAILDASAAANVLTHAKSLRDDAQLTLDTVRCKISEIIQIGTPGLPADLTLVQWEEWLSAREKALQTCGLIEAARREITTANSNKKALTEKIAAALTDIGLSQLEAMDLDYLAAATQTVLDQIGQVKLLRKAVADREQDLVDREADSTKATSRLDDWNKKWDATCCSCWIGEANRIPSTDLVRAILKELPGLNASLNRWNTLRGRVDGMERDQKIFEENVNQLAADLGIEHTLGTPLDTIAIIQFRLERAKADHELYRVKQGELSEAEIRLKKLDSAISALDATKLAMTTHFKVENLAQVAEMLRLSKGRKQLLDQVANSVAEILSATGHGTIEEAVATLETNDVNDLTNEESNLETASSQLELALSSSFAELTKAQDAVDKIGGDDAVVRVEADRRVVQLAVEEHATQYLKLRIGTLAVEQGLQLYREAHRSSMLTNASRAFHIISRGHYDGLATQPDRDGEILIAKGADGSTKYADDLSTGTRLQLYLALRVAGYTEFAAKRPSLPFIADDIMESFDDFRAEEAFRLFEEMARLGQVIYLTHHRHLLPIAKTVCPSVRIHSLVASTSS